MAVGIVAASVNFETKQLPEIRYRFTVFGSFDWASLSLVFKVFVGSAIFGAILVL